MPRSFVYWLLLLNIAACVGSQERKTTIGPPRSVKDGAGTCDEQIARMKGRFDASQGRWLPPPFLDVELPVMSKSKSVDRLGVTVAVRTGHLEVEWQEVAFTGAATAIANATNSSEDGPIKPIYIWADRDMKARYLADLLLLNADVEYRLVVASRTDDREKFAPLAETPTWAVELWKSIQKSRDQKERSSWISRGLAQSLGECSPLAVAFGATATSDGQRDFQELSANSLTAIQSCHCDGLDILGFETMMLAANGATDPKVGWLPLDPNTVWIADGTVANLAEQAANAKF